ncbi:MAG: glycosyltransferase family 39 protein [Lachnospiraceae bacterium]|nr:glycosyltransferase family 39 protein [Lachnospiraceae bacterium]
MIKKLKQHYGVFSILVLGFLTRFIYVINTSVYERGHDVGYYTSLTDGKINIGHLGYIEYIAKFGHLPDFDPFEVFIFYHPPLNHVLGAMVLRISTFFGAGIDAAFKNVQYMELFFSTMCMVVVYLILKRLVQEDKYIVLGLAVFCFHPSLVYMSASINNDMLSTLFELLCVYFGLLWMENFQSRYLYLTGLCIGLGMCAKLNASIMAFPVGLIMLMHFIDSIKDKTWAKCVKEYIVFGLITVPIGMWWTVRNFILFHQTPGVPTGDETDFKYVGFASWIEQFGIPKSLNLSFPFHSAKASYTSNAWLIMFRTAIFTEIWPAGMEEPYLTFCRIAFLFSIALAFVCAILTIYVNIKEIRNGNVYRGTFLLSGYITFILAFIAFVIKYQFTCSSDFRYIAAILVYSAASLAQVLWLKKKQA